MSGCKRLSPASQAGFTLVELLVSLALLGLAATLLSAGMFSVSRARALDLRSPGDSAVFAAQRILRARIEHLVPLAREDLSIPRVQVEGTGTQFAFVAAPLDRDGPGPLRNYRLVLSPGGDLALLSASSLDVRVDPRDPAQAGWSRTTLLEGVRQLDIDYFGPDPRSAEPRWQTDWRGRSTAPDLVRIRASMADRDHRAWPDLVLHIRASVSRNCPAMRRDGACITENE